MPCFQHDISVGPGSDAGSGIAVCSADRLKFNASVAWKHWAKDETNKTRVAPNTPDTITGENGLKIGEVKYCKIM
jgi:hypothetical protein